MNVSEAICTRRSVRHFAERPVSCEVVRKLIDTARWAPSAGNSQPWRVVVVPSESSQVFFSRYEGLGWEYVYPTVRIALAQAARLNNVRIASRELMQRTITTIRDHAFVRGTPCVIVIYREKASLRQQAAFFASILAVIAYRAFAQGCLRKRVTYVIGLLENIFDAIRAHRATLVASLACFIYALTLAAQDLGLASCIQYTYATASGRLRRDFRLGRRAVVVGCVLVGYPEENPDQATDPLYGGSRREVHVRSM
jgi:nitroreductase